MTTHDALQLLLRTLVMYLFVLLLLRLVGKRTVGNFSALDLVVALVISQLMAAPLAGELSVPVALSGIGLLVLMHWLHATLASRSRLVERLSHAAPRELIRDGVIDEQALQAELLSYPELARLLREQDVATLDEVKLATLERDGRLSVLRTDTARELQHGDLLQLLSQTDDETA